MPQNNPHKNKEGYSDPTAYEALRKIDEEDAFGLLMATAHTDTIGAITVKKI